MKDKKVKYVGIGIILLLTIFVGIWIIKNLFPTVNSTLEIMNVLKPFLNAENQSMYVELNVETGEQNLQLEADIYAIKEDTKEYVVIDQNNITLYVVDNMILLENGKAFLLMEERESSEVQMVNYKNILPLLVTAFDEFQINRTEESGIVSYQIEVTGEQMREILVATMPSEADNLETIERLQVKLTTKDGELEQIQMEGLAGATDKQVLLSMRLSNFAVLSDGMYKIPELIKESVENVNKDELFCLTKDVFRLMKAVKPLSDNKHLKGTMHWDVSCGLLQINTDMDLEKLQSLKTEDGNEEVGKEQEAENAVQLIGLVSTMIMEGELSCKEQEDVYVYELTLDEAAMKQLAETLAPEITSYGVDFENGAVELKVENEILSEITIGIEGSFQLLFTKVPTSIGIELDFR